MRKTIWKFVVSHSYRFNVALPKGAEILSVQTQHDTACMWVLVDPEENEREERQFEVFATEKIPNEHNTFRKYIGTFQIDGGDYIYHLFEKITNQFLTTELKGIEPLTSLRTQQTNSDEKE